MTQQNIPAEIGENDIAIIGMSAQLPGADGLGAYWEMLSQGTSGIRKISDDDLRENGEDPARMVRADYVPYAAPLAGFADFEPEFFGFSPKEAAIMDPQHRKFLEVSWEALENAGHMPENFQGAIGVYAGCGMGSYFYFNICSNPDLVEDVGMFLLRHTGNDKDFMATRLSHVLNLKGPSINVQTACSTSLVATHYAAQALLNGECDMAVAGGVTLEIPQGRGYIYKPGEVLSPDGQCHAFDHRAEGTVFGSGAGAVILRRAADAIADGDHIWAIIKGSAVNNDGADKAGYLAPSVGGQAAAIADALALAQVDADTLDYIECHGTGTYLGDPIEVAALTEAFRETTDEVGFCRIGSVKTNIGHTDTAAGVASLIKASLALKNTAIPASLGFEKPNPAIEFDTSPFRVNDTHSDWISHRGPRRAGVNSLGVGGTNAFAVLQEAPVRAASDESDWPFQLLCLSARSKSALEDSTSRLVTHLKSNPDQPLADVAWTLKEGRRAFEKRRVVVAETHAEAATLLQQNDPRRVFTHSVLAGKPDIAFMFPGGGAQYAGMARDLYETEPTFAEWMDKGLDLLAPRLDYDIRALWLPENATDLAEADEKLKRPSAQLPLIMIVEYALAQLWISWGVKPSVLVGHSMGENTAACLAGVISFADCIGLVHLRGELMDSVPAGGMLSVPISADKLCEYMGDALDIAAVNAPDLSVATGPDALLDALEAKLAKDDIECQRIPINIAAHSRMLEPIISRFRAYLQSITLNAPTLPIVSNRSGILLTNAEATDPNYWVGHLRNTVNFADCIATLAATPGRVLLEVGPGKALSSLAQIHPDMTQNQVIHTLRHPNDKVADDAYFMAALGRLWAVGANIDWPQIWGEAKRQRVVLPTYAFQRATYYIEPGTAQITAPSPPMRSEDISDWGYAPLWKKTYADVPADYKIIAQKNPLNYLIFQDETGLSVQVTKQLRDAGQRVVTVRTGDAFSQNGDAFTLAPEMGREGYDQLVNTLISEGRAPDRIAHFWLVTTGQEYRPGSSFFHRNLEQGFFSLLFLAQALGDAGDEGSLPDATHITVVTSGAAQVSDEPLPSPEKATIAGPAKLIPREMPGVSVSTLDLETQTTSKRHRPDPMLVDTILEELLAKPSTQDAALRNGHRYTLNYGPVPLPQGNAPKIDAGGAWLITGGFGGIGLTLAADLIKRHQARIILLSRSDFPARKDWPSASGKSAQRVAQVQKLEALGGQVLVVQADVCNVEEIQAAKAQAEQKFGRLHGVIHAAGAIDDAPLATKTLVEVETIFTPKIHGTQVLDMLFPDGSIDWFVLFSSTSTATAPTGQVDYVAANEYLNAFAKSRSNGATRVVALNWGIWADAGMAADAVAARDACLCDTARTEASAPMLLESALDHNGDRVFTGQLSAETDWIIDEHRLASGEALLPGTGYLELAVESLAAQGETMPYEIRELYFLRALNINANSPRDIRVRLKRSPEGYRLDIRAAQDLDGQAGYVLNSEARVPMSGIKPPSNVDIHALWNRCTHAQMAAETGQVLVSAQEAHLQFGPRWKVLEKCALGDGEGVANLSLPPSAQADIQDGFVLHPALLDIATGWAMALIPGYQGAHLWAPVSYETVRIYKALPAKITSWVMLSEAPKNTPYARFDVTILDENGHVCIEIEGFTIRRIDAGVSMDLNATPAASEVELVENTPENRPHSAAEDRLRHNLSQGIRAPEGAIAFRRALAQDRAQIYVSSMPLPALIEQAGAASETKANTQTFERPALEQDYIAPVGSIETTLAGFWQDLLGVTEIGAEDSFFDLGGHSLIAVRLFARLRKTWNVDFPISVLFEAPTIRKIAGLLAEEGVVENGDPKSDKATTKTPRRRFTHIVPMHDGEGGSKTPFFLVAGMFGNVLNLRHLAHLLGADRPFYGLQARGLLGTEDPHTDVTIAAADMIAEMRQIQPHGPYYLGGFSGGGITAYEIAQQLEAAGEEVAIVILLDTPLPVRRPLSRQDRGLIQLAEFKRKGPGYIVKWAISRVKWEFEKRRTGATQTETATAPQFHNAAIEAAFLQSVATYELKSWSGNLVLFRPPLQGHWQVSNGQWVDSQRAYLFEDNDWSETASGLTIHEVPGDHDSMVLEPNVRVLAARMRAEIQAPKTSNPIAKNPNPQPSKPNETTNQYAAE